MGAVDGVREAGPAGTPGRKSQASEKSATAQLAIRRIQAGVSPSLTGCTGTTRE